VWSPGAAFEGHAIVDLHSDASGRLWIASTEAGLGRIDRPLTERPLAARYSRKQGLPSDNARCLTDNASGRICAGTARGVVRLDPETGGIRVLARADGLANDEVFSALRHSGGDLWFGTLDGLSRLAPGQDPGPPHAPTAWIAGVSVAGQRLPAALLGVRTMSGLRLPHDRRQIEIEFFALAPVPGEPLHYQSRLEGENDSWIAPGTERSVHFGALAPGEYRFEVRAAAAFLHGSPSVSW
jgi:hypothetical protein